MAKQQADFLNDSSLNNTALNQNQSLIQENSVINISAAASEPDPKRHQFSHSSSEDSKIIEEAKMALLEFEKF